MQELKPATKPTMYFIGVTTTKSSIMKLFPYWIKEFGIGNACIAGIDMPIHAPREEYREVTRFIKHDPLSLGALVTTHKIDMFNAAADLFDDLDQYAVRFGELSCIFKDAGRLKGYARDPITSGLAMEEFIPAEYWEKHSGQAFIMGAGGSAIAISANLLSKKNGHGMPSRLFISNRSQPRLDSIERVVTQLCPEASVEYCLCPKPEQNDAILFKMEPHSLVVNATGLGKDRPGSPLTDSAQFPFDSIVWELNYRGELDFMHQAERQADKKRLHVEDGWRYFIHGWTRMMSDIFHIEMTPDLLGRIVRIADAYRNGELGV